MPRWITFDEQTRSALRSANRVEAELCRGDALDAVLDAQHGIAVLPAANGDALLVTVQRNEARAAEAAAPAPARATVAPPQTDVARWQDPEAVGYEASGFLGLLDAPLYEEDVQPPPQKSWWQKLVG